MPRSPRQRLIIHDKFQKNLKPYSGEEDITIPSETPDALTENIEDPEPISTRPAVNYQSLEININYSSQDPPVPVFRAKVMIKDKGTYNFSSSTFTDFTAKFSDLGLPFPASQELFDVALYMWARSPERDGDYRVVSTDVRCKGLSFEEIMPIDSARYRIIQAKIDLCSLFSLEEDDGYHSNEEGDVSFSWQFELEPTLSNKTFQGSQFCRVFRSGGKDTTVEWFHRELFGDVSPKYSDDPIGFLIGRLFDMI
jgi:hypothetical protein